MTKTTATALKLGMIGLDTSHTTAFAQLLNDPQNPHHVPGGRVAVAFPGGSPDFKYDYVPKYTAQLRDEFGVSIVDSPEQVARECDAILLVSVDGRAHPQLLEAIAPYGKPVFVDKPFAVCTADAVRMFGLAERYGFPLMSASSLRYAQPLTEALWDGESGAVIGADTQGPMALEPTQPGLFWYGIHAVEMLYAILGPGCIHVTAETSEHHELVVGKWKDGRIGTVRGNRKGNGVFGAVVHREKGSRCINAYAGTKPFYACMLEEVLTMFQTGGSPLAKEETIEIVRFIEAANESRHSGDTVDL
ncbi:Gfo/Idh/MocA family protein [Paenibacillus hodogayensis]|uniref:Gfo/Idh/MocA family protein n=1 Tax=Paenibacillus hodogayensis TaxID=279208 RepID=A0ABV5VTB5_9BACL